MTKSKKARFDALKVAASALAITAGAGLGSQAAAQTYANGLEPVLDIVTNHEVPPAVGPHTNPALGSNYSQSPFVLDPAGINGVGQQIAFIQTGPAAAGLSLCTGTLINPRTVITAAHCVFNNPAHMYGSDTGTGGGVNGPFGTGGATITSQGIPYSFGFSSTNRCIAPNAAYPMGNGCTVGTGPYEQWRDSGFTTQAHLGIYNANQIWYNRNAQPVALGGGGEFANGDIALATLDTHAEDIPTWTLLFSQLDGPTHSTITGYGNAGVGLPGIGHAAGIDYRRRSAENMIDALFNQEDWGYSPAVGFPAGHPSIEGRDHAIYWNDFDDPDFNNIYNPATWCIDTLPGAANNAYCDQNGLGGVTLAREGSTAGGDSGGPLIVDQRFDRPVVAGVLTGTWSATGIVSYGQWNVYPPLFLFWEEIVTNNPYVYAGNLAGNRDWTNPAHWVQMMDPNYAIIGPDGELMTSLPSLPQGGPDGDVDKFGQSCFFGDCTDFTETYTPDAAGPHLVIPGGPGSTNFVPNNVEPVNSANAALHVRARYYDVTLAAPGTTTLNSNVTIDRFTMANGATNLDIRSGGTLNVWSDATITAGLLNVNGAMNTGEMLVVNGIITGTGTIDPTYLTSVIGAIAPNGVNVGTLSVRGDVVLASGNNYFVEVGRDGADMLRILEDAADGTSGNIMLGGTLRMVKASNGPAPRHGQVFTLVAADGAVLDTFDTVYAQTGVLRPEMVYNADSVQIILRAGKFADVLEGNVHELAFAHALDELRAGSYGLLYDLYGELDVMDFSSLQRAFGALTPSSLLDAHAIMAMQGSAFGDTLQDRMSLIARNGASGFSVTGDPSQVLAFGGDAGLGAAGELAFASRLTESRHVANMPNGMSAFFSGGYDEGRNSAISGRESVRTDDGLRTWQMVGGIEQSFGDVTLGVAAGYSRGESFQATGAQAENELAQTAVYGVYSLDNGMYLSGMVGAGSSRVSTERRYDQGLLNYQMAGDLNGEVFLASFEAGANYDVFNGNMVLTPNFGVRQYTVRMDEYAERGGAETALNISEQVYDRLEAHAGARLVGDFAFDNGWNFVPSLDASVVANLSGDENGVWANFVQAPDVPFYLSGATRDDYWGEVAGGMSLVRGDTSFALRMETSVGRQELHEDRVTMRFAQKF